MAIVKQKCSVFIDNSSLYIEGQKSFARLKNLQMSVPMDIRFRVDIGRIVDALLRGREKIYAKLYGCEPPPNDSLWQEIRSRGILVDTFQKNSEDYEVALDTLLTADVTEQSCELRHQEPMGSVTFIIIGGDGDYLSAYEKVLKRNWKLEIAAWNNCLSQKARKFVRDKQGKGVSLMLLDYLATSNPNIYFLESRWTAHQWFPRDRTIVFEYGKPVENKEAKQLSCDITNLIKFPCWYLHRPEKDEKIVMIVIITNQKEGKYSMGTLYEGIKAKFATRCKRIVDFVTFIQEEQNPVWQNDFLFNYKYFEEEEEEESKHCKRDHAAGGGDESGEGEFTVVEPKG